MSLPEGPSRACAAGRSLLWPARQPLPLRRLDWLALAAAYAIAIGVRSLILDANPYTAEAAHYAVARNLWDGGTAIQTVYHDWRPDTAWLFWQRPLFSLLLWPGAAVSFEAYRLWHAALSSLLAPLAYALARQLGTPAAAAAPAGLVLAVHPALVPWGVLALPDSLLAVFTLAAILAAHNGRPLACGLLLLAAAWTKEVGTVTIVALFALAFLRDADGSRGSLWPLRLGPFGTAALAAAALALVPLLLSLRLPQAQFPGWGVGGDGRVVVERLFLLVWLAPVAAAGLLLPNVRRLSALALAWSGFFLAYHFILGRAIEAWYTVLPATLTLVAAAAALGAAWKALPRRRWLPAAAGAALAALLVLQVAVADTEPAKRALVTPLSGEGQWSLPQALAHERARDGDLQAILARLGANDTRLLAIDVDWSFLHHPLSGRFPTLYAQMTGLTEFLAQDLRPLTRAIADRTDATLLGTAGTRLNGLLREVYADCAVAREGAYVLLRGCPDRFPELDRLRSRA